MLMGCQVHKVTIKKWGGWWWVVIWKMVVRGLGFLGLPGHARIIHPPKRQKNTLPENQVSTLVKLRPLVCEDKNVPYVFVKSKTALGRACGVSRHGLRNQCSSELRIHEFPRKNGEPILQINPNSQKSLQKSLDEP